MGRIASYHKAIPPEDQPLRLSELQKRLQAAESIELQRRLKAVYLLLQKTDPSAVARQTGYNLQHVYLLGRLYAEGGIEALQDHRAGNSGRKPLLTDEQLQRLAEAIQQPPPKGRKWTGPLVAEWISQLLDRSVSPQRGSEYLQRAKSLLDQYLERE